MKIIVRATTASIVFIALLGCSSVRNEAQLRDSFPDGALLAAYEAFTSPEDHSFVSCLAVEKLDPPADVVALLHSEKRDVVPASQCTYVIESSGSYQNATKRRAMFVRISHLRLQKDGSATGSISIYHHGLFGSFGDILLLKRNGKWQVAVSRPRGVS